MRKEYLRDLYGNAINLSKSEIEQQFQDNVMSQKKYIKKEDKWCANCRDK